VLRHGDRVKVARKTMERVPHLRSLHREAWLVTASSGSSAASLRTDFFAACQSGVKYIGGPRIFEHSA
jgi:hypothetical protein